MPTRTFMNLSKEKRIRILRSAKKEFSRVPVEKAVIANIVKDAKIPRGSFYQYFDNIDDLFTYLMNYLYGVDKKKFARHLQQAGNDVYEALKINFSAQIDKLTITENRQFRINVLKTLLNDGMAEKYSNATSLESVEFIDLDYFPEDVRKSEKSKNLMQLIIMVGKNCIQKYLMKSANEDEIKNDYNKYIDFLKLGFSKF